MLCGAMQSKELVLSTWFKNSEWYIKSNSIRCRFSSKSHVTELFLISLLLCVIHYTFPVPLSVMKLKRSICHLSLQWSTSSAKSICSSPPLKYTSQRVLAYDPRVERNASWYQHALGFNLKSPVFLTQRCHKLLSKRWSTKWSETHWFIYFFPIYPSSCHSLFGRAVHGHH